MTDFLENRCLYLHIKQICCNIGIHALAVNVSIWSCISGQLMNVEKALI